MMLINHLPVWARLATTSAELRLVAGNGQCSGDTRAVVCGVIGHCNVLHFVVGRIKHRRSGCYASDHRWNGIHHRNDKGTSLGVAGAVGGSYGNSVGTYG